MRGRDPASLPALGAKRTGESVYELPVFGSACKVDLGAGSVSFSPLAGFPSDWDILVLHYLSADASRVGASSRWVGFADILEARGYESVFRKRVIERLCATAGRDRETFVRACGALGGEKFGSGDEGFQFRVFPLLQAVIVWYAGDDELPTGASFLYPDNVRSFLPIEDMVVLAEGLVGLLGKAITAP